VLIRVPSTKQDPPLTTLKEGAQLAARLSKAVSGGKVRVVYTQCRFVRKIAKGKPGLVRYENERTIEVDTSGPMPESLKRLYAQRH
jgi:predicted ribosome quality control (RQC) complex YloA/Tae2 family protein